MQDWYILIRNYVTVQCCHFQVRHTVFLLRANPSLCTALTRALKAEGSIITDIYWRKAQSTSCVEAGLLNHRRGIKNEAILCRDRLML